MVQPYLYMFDHVDDLAGGVGVGNEALVRHVTKFTERQNQLLQHGFRHVRAVLTQHRHF